MGTKKQVNTPGAPGAANRNSNPLAPTAVSATTRMTFDDVALTDMYQAGVHPRYSSITPNADSANGSKGVRGRTATNASAQFRITAKLAPYSEPPAAGTMASARLLPPVMGSKQFTNFEADRSFSVNGG